MNDLLHSTQISLSAGDKEQFRLNSDGVSLFLDRGLSGLAVLVRFMGPEIASYVDAFLKLLFLARSHGCVCDVHVPV